MNGRGVSVAAGVLLAAAVLTFAEYAPNIGYNADLERLLMRIDASDTSALPASLWLQPYNYAEVKRYLEISDSSRTQQLSSTERLLLERARRRFGPDKGLFTWKKKSDDLRLKINLDLLGDVRPGYDDSAKVTVFGIVAPSLAGNVGKLSFYSGIRVWTEYRSDTLFAQSTYQPYDGIAYNLYGRETGASVRSSDLPHGGIRYDAGRITLETAIDRLRSGPARYFPVTLSGAAPPITYFRGTIDLDVIEYRHVVGLLKVEKDQRKFLYMHRLSFDLWKQRIHGGINEVIVYGNTTSEPHSDTDAVVAPYIQRDRSPEWAYLIPFIPFKFVEHYNGDRDNAALSVDLTLSWPKHWRWYGEFFMDDMLSPVKLFNNDWGNKWAFTVGANWFGSVAGYDATVAAEYSRVEPWVYTHFGGGSHRYSHFNASLGAPLGPNSQAAILTALVQIHPLHEVGVGLNHFAWNRSVRGGSITDVFQYADPLDSTRYHDVPTKRFLGPGTMWYLQPALYWNFNMFGRFAFNASTMLDVLDKKGRFTFAAGGGLYF